jgi:hypothetical protein
MKNNLRIGVRRKTMAAILQFSTELPKIEDLAVVNDPKGLIFVGDRLSTALDVHDAQARIAQTRLTVDVNTEFIGSAMPDHGQHQ